MLHPDIPSQTTTRLIVADGDDSERAALCRQLAADDAFVICDAQDWTALKGLLDESAFDVVVMGAHVGGISGTEVNEKIRSAYPDPPGTILLGGDNTRAAVRAFHCGFLDYLPVDAANERELRSAVTRAAKIVRTERLRRQYVAELEKMAQRDGITGIANRSYLDDRLEQLARIGKQRRLQFAAILVRVSELDDIHAAFGCRVADRALHAFANRLKTASRSSDTFGRFDHDTFLFLLDRDVSPESIAVACRRLLDAASFVVNLDDLALSLTASVGAAAFPVDGSTVPDLLRAAENALRSGAPNEKPEASAQAARHPGMSRAKCKPEAAPTGTPPNQVGREGAGEVDAARTSHLVERSKDRRAGHRYRSLKSGLLVLENGLGTVNCVVRDLSSTGARISVDGLFNVPDTAELVLVESRKKVRVETRWQKGSELGLMFVD